MSVIEAPGGVKEIVQQLPAVSEPRSGIEPILPPSETVEEAYKIEARAELQQHVVSIKEHPPLSLDIKTLGLSPRAKELFRTAGVEVIARERTKVVPLLPVITHPSDHGLPSHPVDKARIVHLVREEPLDQQLDSYSHLEYSDEEVDDKFLTYDQIVDRTIVDSIMDLYGYVYYGHADLDKFREHLIKQGNDEETREAFRKSLSPEDRAEFEAATRNNQVRKYAITRVASGLSALAHVLDKLQLAPEKAKQLALAERKISYLFEGDKAHGIPRYINAPEDQKLAMVRLVVDKAVEGLELTLGSDPNAHRMPLYVT